MKILIVDDDPDLCRLLTMYLEFKLHRVFIANTLTDGLNKLTQLHPDVLFLDNNLPDGYGWEKLLEISTGNPGMIITLITGFSSSKKSLPVLDHTPRSFTVIEKPISYNEVDLSLSSL